MAATELDTSTFATDVLHSAQPGTLLVVEVYAGWAGSCKPVASTLRSLSHALSDGSIKFLQANSDTVAAQALEPYRARCQPVFLLYKGGELCKAVVGVQGPELVAAITALSDPASGSGGGV